MNENVPEFLNSANDTHDGFAVLTDTGPYVTGPAYERVMIIDSIWGPMRLHLRIDDTPPKSHAHVAVWTEVGWKMVHQLAHPQFWNGVPSAMRVRSGRGDPERTTLRTFERLVDEAWPVVCSAMEVIAPLPQQPKR